MRMPYFADPENLTEPEEPEQLTRLDITAHEVLKSIYQDPNQPISLRCRAAIKAIEVETPKVSAVAVTTMDERSFAAALDRAIERSKNPQLLNAPRTIEHEPLVSAAEMNRPFPRPYRRF
jgi:hypothetical protein